MQYNLLERSSPALETATKMMISDNTANVLIARLAVAALNQRFIGGYSNRNPQPCRICQAPIPQLQSDLGQLMVLVNQGI